MEFQLDETQEEFKILDMTLTRKWFDLYLEGIKKSDFRDDKAYWRKRLWTGHNGLVFTGLKYTHIRFRNGYGNHRPWFIVPIQKPILHHCPHRGDGPCGEPVDGKTVFQIMVGNIVNYGNLLPEQRKILNILRESKSV